MNNDQRLLQVAALKQQQQQMQLQSYVNSLMNLTSQIFLRTNTSIDNVEKDTETAFTIAVKHFEVTDKLIKAHLGMKT